MARKSKFAKLEERHKKPLAEILLEKLNTFRNINLVAGDIDISPRYVVEKMDELGIEANPPSWHIRDAETEHAE